jgi:hypothetical protein
MIISCGVNIYPQETENVLIMHPKVSDVAVFGIPNEEYGEEVKAVVQPVDTAQPGPELEEELLEYCRQHLAKIKCPRSIDFEKELPRAPTGKLFKRRLKERYWKGTVTGIGPANKMSQPEVAEALVNDISLKCGCMSAYRKCRLFTSTLQAPIIQYFVCFVVSN